MPNINVGSLCIFNHLILLLLNEWLLLLFSLFIIYQGTNLNSIEVIKDAAVRRNSTNSNFYSSQKNVNMCLKNNVFSILALETKSKLTEFISYTDTSLTAYLLSVLLKSPLTFKDKKVTYFHYKKNYPYNKTLVAIPYCNVLWLKHIFHYKLKIILIKVDLFNV